MNQEGGSFRCQPCTRCLFPTLAVVLPATVFHREMQRLSMHGNNLREIPRSIQRLVNLERLMLNRNSLTGMAFCCCVCWCGGFFF